MMEQPICGNTCLTKSKSINNHLKLLKMELGQQISIKSPFKLKRDAVERAQLNMRNRLAFDSSCWFNKHVNVVEEYKHWGPLQYLLPNSRIGFFYSCITQKFHVNDPCPSSTRTYFDGPDEIGDVYSNANSYQNLHDGCF